EPDRPVWPPPLPTAREIHRRKPPAAAAPAALQVSQPPENAVPPPESPLLRKKPPQIRVRDPLAAGPGVPRLEALRTKCKPARSCQLSRKAVSRQGRRPHLPGAHPPGRGLVPARQPARRSQIQFPGRREEGGPAPGWPLLPYSPAPAIDWKERPSAPDGG